MKNEIDTDTETEDRDYVLSIYYTVVFRIKHVRFK